MSEASVSYRLTVVGSKAELQAIHKSIHVARTEGCYGWGLALPAMIPSAPDDYPVNLEPGDSCYFENGNLTILAWGHVTTFVEYLCVRWPDVYVVGVDRDYYGYGSRRWVCKCGFFHLTDVKQYWDDLEADDDDPPGVRTIVHSGRCVPPWKAELWFLRQPPSELMDDIQSFAAQWCAAHPWEEPMDPSEWSGVPHKTDEELGIVPCE